MGDNIIYNKDQKSFYLNKWFLDCTTKKGEALIFYAAQLKWGKWEVPYTAMLTYHPLNGLRYQSKFTKVQLPEQIDHTIFWNEPRFGVEGKWKALASPLQARILETTEGYVDWNCYQPKSNVQLIYKGEMIKGLGYAEQLILTLPAWKIPMEELRWGSYTSKEDNLVWIELRGEEKQQWLWFNGEKIEHANIEDNQIDISSKEIILELDRSTTLEAEKKILQVVKRIVRYIPGLKKFIPLQFLMADECKWFSNGILKKHGKQIGSGYAIHEFVNFNP